MPPEEMPALYLLPDWAVLTQIGQRLRDAEAEDGDIPEAEMELLLTVLRMSWRLILLHWQDRKAMKNHQAQEEPIYGLWEAEDQVPGPFDPRYPAA